MRILTKRFCRKLTLTYESLKEFFESGSLEFSSMCISESSLKAKALNSVIKFIKEKRISNLKSIYEQVLEKVNNLPLLEDTIQATRMAPLD